jgi:uncharacterized protein (TIGR03067 family)
MFKTLCSLVVSSLLVLSVEAGDDAKKDLEKLQGSWTVVDIVDGGEKAPAEEAKAMSVVCKKDEITVKVKLADKKNEEEVVASFTVKLDPSQKPNSVDFIHTSGKDKGKKVLGIYKIDGDSVSFCYGEIDQARPKEFVSPAKSTLTLVILKRK